jgi:putative mRNA 3-end processing factor
VSTQLADVTGRGAVLLGPDVTCDGFHHGYPVRVQTHVHSDHMDGFDSSKGEQYIYCTRPTRALLIADQDADLPYRTNLIEIEYGEWTEHADTRFMLIENGHMLGSAQVVAETGGGYRVGYSSDFAGGVQNPIQVDTLVVDATCGEPALVREYSQELAERCLLDTCQKSLAHSPVFIRAARGTLQRAMVVLAGNLPYPILCSERLMREIDVYRAYGQPISEVIPHDSDLGRELSAGGRYVRVFGNRDKVPVDTSTVTMIALNAYVPSGHPLVEHSERSYTIALTNHADFDETLAYIAATGASEVIADCTRSKHAQKLATEVWTRLGVQARTSTSEKTYGWGT